MLHYGYYFVYLKDIDLNIIKKEELDFTCNYQITNNRSDSVEGFITWFDTYFTPCHLPVVLSTSLYYLNI